MLRYCADVGNSYAEVFLREQNTTDFKTLVFLLASVTQERFQELKAKVTQFADENELLRSKVKRLKKKLRRE